MSKVLLAVFLFVTLVSRTHPAAANEPSAESRKNLLKQLIYARDHHIELHFTATKDLEGTPFQPPRKLEGRVNSIMSDDGKLEVEVLMTVGYFYLNFEGLKVEFPKNDQTSQNAPDDAALFDLLKK